MKITGVREEVLALISDEDVRREGYEKREDYIRAFAEINGLGLATALLWDVYVVDFELVEALG